MRIITAGVLLALFTSGRSQNANCDFTQNVSPFMTYFVYSPGYPRLDPSFVIHSWGPMQMDRTMSKWLQLPYRVSRYYPATGCSMDRLLVSRTGDPQLSSAEYYCGRGTLTVTSDGQRLSVGLISSNQSPGGKFFCRLTAQPATVTPAPCRCGYKKTNRIVGGQETGVNEFPMMAGIVYVEQAKIRCGGVIISKKHVMSAAHCVTNKKTSDLAVVVGEHNVNEGESPATQAFRVTRIQVHPLYSTSNNDNDISILTLHTDIVFSDRVGPVCLPFKFANSDFAGSKVTVLGWGTLFPGGPTSSTLQKVDVDVISQASCRSQVSSVTNRQLCTYTPGKDSCQDDSGGPLLFTDPSNGLLYSVGIVSYGMSCASRSPAINARVTAFLEWIVVTTKEDFCKV